MYLFINSAFKNNKVKKIVSEILNYFLLRRHLQVYVVYICNKNLPKFVFYIYICLNIIKIKKKMESIVEATYLEKIINFLKEKI